MCVLSNGALHSVLTSAGGGYSRWKGFDVSRWRSDATADSWGRYIYLRDTASGALWSATNNPLPESANFDVRFDSHCAVFSATANGIESELTVAVSPEDDVEVFTLVLKNTGEASRCLEVTTYQELALATHGADRAHPAFSKLFTQTAYISDYGSLLAWRRLRSTTDTPIFAALVPAVDGAIAETVQYETDRAEFLGRGRSPRNPVAVDRPLSGGQGFVLDPIFSLRHVVDVPAGETVLLAYSLVVGDERGRVLGLAQKYRELSTAVGVCSQARAASERELSGLGISESEACSFQQLAGHLLYADARLSAPLGADSPSREVLAAIEKLGLGGETPIVVLRLRDGSHGDLVGELIAGQRFLAGRGLEFRLAVVTAQRPLAVDDLLPDANNFVQYVANWLTDIELATLLARAHVVLDGAQGGLAEQLRVVADPDTGPAPEFRTPDTSGGTELKAIERLHFNGYGGFTPDAREYVIDLPDGVHTPRPWTNVMSTPGFGTLLTDGGGGFTWAINSQSGRLTPWSNDPISDHVGEAVFIHERASGQLWSATPLPVREAEPYRIRHGQGYSVVEHTSHDIEQTTTTFVPCDDSDGLPVKIQRIRFVNRSNRERRLSVTSYAEWVLGVERELDARHVVTAWLASSNAIVARNPFSPTLGNLVAFSACLGEVVSHSGDRMEVIGRNGALSHPHGLLADSLSNRVGGGLDPCAALSTEVVLPPGGDAEVVFVLGCVASEEAVGSTLAALSAPGEVDRRLSATTALWDRVLGTIEVETPDTKVNVMLNRWLLYQALSCRFWGRSGFFQSGGAFGFRDQLQDSTGLTYTLPGLTRAHLLRCASRQFEEGDVQHWWHPDSGGGVRTRMTDDLLWLPFVTAHYIRVTGDASVLDEQVPFVTGRHVRPDEHDVFYVPGTLPKTASLYDHCRLAIERGTTSGAHGLPLMGTGDWNDGMNLVGAGGVGESIWLAWFLIQVLNDFAELTETRDAGDAQALRERAKRIASSIDANAWDGDWYVRAYYDDGSTLGSHSNFEARIDSIAQSWAVITGAGDPGRARRAMESVNQFLVKDEEKLVMLFTPPFDTSPQMPGYIKGYPAGVRENGGQYTHGSLWSALAWARLGDGDQAERLLNIMNPVHHGSNPDKYLVEPYVIAADIYSIPERAGMGGWTWYTGSASWMYRIWLEEVLGFHLNGSRLTIKPVLPSSWPGYKLRYRFGTSTYAIEVKRGEGDGTASGQTVVDLVDDGAEHAVLVSI